MAAHMLASYSNQDQEFRNTVVCMIDGGILLDRMSMQI